MVSDPVCCVVPPFVADLAEYEGDLDVDDALVEALVRAAQTVAERVAALGLVA